MTGKKEEHVVRGSAFDSETHDERQERYHALFVALDVNKDGTICVDDLSEAFRAMDMQTRPHEAQQLLTMSDANQDGRLDFREFVQYLTEREQKLQLEFRFVDGNKDGVLDVDDIVQAFQRLGIAVEKAEAARLVKRMAKDKRFTVGWDEWRNFLLLRPVTNLQDILHYWRYDTLDIGEDLAVPKDFTVEELETGKWWRHLIAGGIAGAVSRTVTAPLDRLKIMLQVHGFHNRQLGILNGFKGMLLEGGIKSLWRGNGINVIKIAPESAVKFMTYEQFKRIIKSYKSADEELEPFERFIAGASAGAFAQSAIYPMEVLKTRMAIGRTGQYGGVFDCARKIYLREGMASFYRGYIPNLIGIIPYAGIDLMVYEQLKHMYTRWQSSAPPQPQSAIGEPSVLVLLLCGAASSTAGQFVSYPLALVRTRMQAAAASAGASRPATSDVLGTLSLGYGDRSCDSMLATIRGIVQRDGFFGLYRGLLPNFLKVAPAVSISYAVYEKASRALGIKMS